MTTRSRYGRAGLVTTLVLVLGACGNGQSQKVAQTHSRTVSDQTTTTSTNAASTTTEPRASSAPSSPGPKGPVLGSSEAKIAASPADSSPVAVHLDVLSMERLPGDLVEARFRVSNVGNGADLTPFFSFTRGGSYNTSGAAIIDLQGSRRYESLQDSGGRCLCSDIPITARIPPGDSADYYARFGAPPTGVTEVDFELPGFPPVRSVPLA